MSSEATCPIHADCCRGSASGTPRTYDGRQRWCAVLHVRRSHRGHSYGCREAFIFGCTAVDSDDISIKFDVDESHVGMTFTFGDRGDCR